MACLSCTFPSSLYIRRLLGSSCSLSMMARSLSNVAVSSNDNKVLPFSAMPGPKGTIPNILGYVFGKGSHFEIVSKRFDKFGPIYREQVLDMRIVNICDVDAVTKVLRTETSFQMRPGLEAFIDVVDGKGSGLISNDYEQWYPDRSLLSPKLLRPKDVNERLPIINAVTNDFVERLHRLRKHDGTIHNIEEELSYWSIESNSSFLFNQRLGFYNNPPDPAAVVFFDAALKMVYNMGNLFHSGPFYKYIPTPAYNAVKKNLNIMNEAYIEIFDKVVATKQTKQTEQDSSKTESVFEYLFAKRKFTQESRTIISGLMAAGVDTTSTTCLWLLYLLSRHPNIQEKLYQELISVFGPEDEVSATKTPSYLKAALKESQRLYPVAAVFTRVFNEDIELHGYHIPAGVNILFQNHLSSVDERHYGEDANQFVPGRWLRDAETGKRKDLNPFSSLPFGHGVRMCIGRRIAESFIYTLVSKILLRYRLEFAGKTEVNQILKGGNMKPDPEILLKFIPR